MTPAVYVSPPGALDDLGAKIREYREVSGKSGAAVLLQKGAQLIFGNQDPRYGAVFPGLEQLYQAEAPRAGAITASAKARGFRLGRKQFGKGKLSPTAIERAQAWMGGYKSILAVVTESNGRIDFRGVRVGVRGRRLLGGRKGHGGFAVPGVVDDARQAGDVRLNFRAVATVMEINLREAGRRFLAVGWLFNQWRRLAASDPRRADGTTFRTLQKVNPRSRLGLLGEAELAGQEETGNVSLRITSFVPGTLAVGQARGLFARAIAGVTADIKTYLARKNKEAFLDWVRTGHRAA